MIRWKMMMGVARAEARLTRRLVRYWIFMAVAAIVGIFFYAQYSLLHYLFSSASATVGALNPRFLISDIGFRYLFVFLIGVVFLAMDIRSRDVRERMVEVLDALPCTNLELVLGKFIGVFVPSWIPLALIILGIWGSGYIWDASVQPHTVLYLLLFMAIPAFTVLVGVAYCVLLLVPHRGAAAVLLLALMAAIWAGFFFSPIWLAPAVDMTGAFMNSFPSDIIPEVISGEALLQRFAVLLLGLGFLWMAAGFHPRKDDGSFAKYTGTGLVMIIIAAVALGGIVFARKQGLETRQEWRVAHEARLEDPAPNLSSIRGEIVVDPGDELAMDLELRFLAPGDSTLDSALFTLNPGILVSEARDSQGRDLQFTQENGLLELALNDSLPPGQETSVKIAAAGMPEMVFGYLDGAKDPLDLQLKEAQLIILGFISAINTDTHVTLLPGSCWLPVSGVDVGRGGSTGHPTDFFMIDLTVSVPEGWTVVMPGRRQEADGGQAGKDSFRFAPGAPVDQVALIADEYLTHSMEVSGVEAEVLVHPAHDMNMEVFSDSTEAIKDWMEEKLDEAASLGLPYPYDSIRLVEVPNAVRGFGGGWRLGSTLSPSGMILMKESGFPMARFDAKFKDADQFEDQEGGMPAAKVARMEMFFDNDFNGGNPFPAAARNFFTGLTAGEGAEGLPLDFVFEELSSRLVIGRHSYFSAYLFTPDMQQVINQTMGTYFQQSGGSRGAFIDTLMDTVTSRASVWDKTLNVSLKELDPWEEPRDTVDILTLKGGAMAESMIDDLGREETGTFLAALRERSQGESYSREDVLEAGRQAGSDLAPWLDTWIGQTDLPGFLVPDNAAEVYRLEDTEDGSARYQILVRITNGEKVPGLLRVEYRAGDQEGGFEDGSTDPIKVPGSESVEIGLVSSKPPSTIKVLPYLSLNRSPFTLGLGIVDSEDIRSEEPFTGSRPVELLSRDEEVIIVDDLDEGFEIVDGDSGSGMRIKSKAKDNVETDQGLPVMVPGQGVSEWSRYTTPEAFGKYRHTFAIVKGGSGDRTAVFGVEIPQAGSWDLEVYLPRDAIIMRRALRDTDSWKFAVEDDSGSQDVTFEAQSGESGWNSLGSFELSGGETRVILSDETEGRMVIADAIRWVRSSGSPTAGAVEE